LSRPRADPAAACASLLEAVAEAAADFDVIHSHVDWMHLPLLRRLRTPFLTTLHGRLDLPEVSLAMQRFPGAPFVSISQSQRTPLPDLHWLATIHHGMPSDLLALCEQPEGYLAFLGRITAEKGPDIAIRVARAAGLPLRIAAKVPRAENRYFNETIKPLLDGNNVRFVGEVNDRQKQPFLANASALLFPIDWPEPFGLVIAEALACGTPVIARRRGSVPEVIAHGLTGQIGETEEELAELCEQIHNIDRTACRAEAERRFSPRAMTDGYEAVYRRVLAEHASPAASSPVGGSVDHRAIAMPSTNGGTIPNVAPRGFTDRDDAGASVSFRPPED
jgi:glycosyltransferase involved in cell wall biosynthesis